MIREQPAIETIPVPESVEQKLGGIAEASHPYRFCESWMDSNSSPYYPWIFRMEGKDVDTFGCKFALHSQIKRTGEKSVLGSLVGLVVTMAIAKIQ